jgi:hypothetical protein
MSRLVEKSNREKVKIAPLPRYGKRGYEEV